MALNVEVLIGKTVSKAEEEKELMLTLVLNSNMRHSLWPVRNSDPESRPKLQYR